MDRKVGLAWSGSLWDLAGMLDMVKRVCDRGWSGASGWPEKEDVVTSAVSLGIRPDQRSIE